MAGGSTFGYGHSACIGLPAMMTLWRKGWKRVMSCPANRTCKKFACMCVTPIAFFFQPVSFLVVRSISFSLLGARLGATVFFDCFHRMLHCVRRCLRRVEWVEQAVGAKSCAWVDVDASIKFSGRCVSVCLGGRPIEVRILRWILGSSRHRCCGWQLAAWELQMSMGRPCRASAKMAFGDR